MFTGIVGEVVNVLFSRSGRLSVAAGEVLEGLDLGDSISVNGVCLTVNELNTGSFSADVMAETMSRSNLEKLSVGDRVNLERSVALGGPMGGHLVQGHIDDTGRVVSISRNGEATIIKFSAPAMVMRYIVEKGFIALDGASLTVTARDNESFQVSVVDYTRQNTILGEMKVGDEVNLEVDIIAKYVEQFVQGRPNGITAEFLQGHGFPVS